MTLASFGVAGQLRPSIVPMTFEYLHAFEPIALPEQPSTPCPTLVAEDDVVLRFGMLEGDARVKGDRVVYDPQSPNASFHENGSSAGALAMILSGRELLSLAPGNAKKGLEDETVRHMPNQDILLAAIVAQRDLPSPPQVVLVKDGLGGLTVFHGDQPTCIPSFAAESFFRIGSGDVTAAAFAHAWGELRWDPIDAARYAARCTAHFVEGPRLPLPKVSEVKDRVPNVNRRGVIRIVGLGDFELQALVLTTRSWLSYLGGNVQHVSLGVDELDSRVDDGVDLLLIGSRCSWRELETAARSGLRPTVVFWPSANADASRVYFPEAMVTSDYATALYHVMRSPER